MGRLARKRVFLPAVALAAFACAAVYAQAEAEKGPTIADVKFLIDNLWVLIACALVFIMHLGFATLESGLTRSKNTVNILFKNTMIICIGLLTYGLCGFALMYPGFAEGGGNEVFGYGGWGITTSDADKLGPAYGNYTVYTDFFFQAMFAATAATIVSGAVAGRIKLKSFLIWSTLFVGVCYPIVGSWKWGYGFLDDWGFYDFAGSTLVHSVGGWGALVMAILLGPRIGKFDDQGRVRPIPGSSMPLAAIGVFLLWLGWFGFNGGSVLSADAGSVSLVLVTTSMAAAAGGVTAGMVSWFFGKKPDLSMALNGILAGLVGITAGADQMAIWEAVVIGVVAGHLVYFSVLTVDKLKIDDPVGAISVHLTCGIWGTLAVGILGAKASGSQLWNQAVGVFFYAVATVTFALVVGLAVKATIGLRVPADEEEEGLDLGEHGMEAYQL